MEGKSHGALFEVTGPDGERIADAISKCQNDLSILRQHYSELADALNLFHLRINQKDADQRPPVQNLNCE